MQKLKELITGGPKVQKMFKDFQANENTKYKSGSTERNEDNLK